MITVEFRGHQAYPGIIAAGVSDEFGIQKIKFLKPVSGVAKINLTYANDDVDVYTLDDDGVWDIGSSVTQHPGETKAYLTITDGHGGYLWKSREFTVLIYQLDDIDDAVEHQYPSAIERALDEIEQIKEECQYYAERAAQVWDQKMHIDSKGDLVIKYSTDTTTT